LLTKLSKINIIININSSLKDFKYEHFPWIWCHLKVLFLQESTKPWPLKRCNQSIAFQFLQRSIYFYFSTYLKSLLNMKEISIKFIYNESPVENLLSRGRERLSWLTGAHKKILMVTFCSFFRGHRPEFSCYKVRWFFLLAFIGFFSLKED